MVAKKILSLKLNAALESFLLSQLETEETTVFETGFRAAWPYFDVKKASKMAIMSVAIQLLCYFLFYSPHFISPCLSMQGKASG